MAATRRGIVLVLGITVPLLAIRLFTPYELWQTDQGKQAQYVLDAVQNGNWLAPGSLGVAATKPPLYTWLAALVSKLAGTIDETTIRVPTVLAALGLVLVTWDIVRRLAGPRAAAAGAIALATTHHFILLSGVVRTDGLLSFLLAAQVLVYVRCLDDVAMPSRWVLASAALAALACLAKGPAGLLSCGVVAAHLVATGRRARAWIEAGVPALAGIAMLAAWFVAAHRTRHDVYDTMIGGELATVLPGEDLPNPLYYVIHTPSRLAPWILALLPAGIWAWRSLRDRAKSPVSPLVSVAFAWFGVHLVAFTFVTHQRPDLIYPAEPAICLLVAGLVGRPLPAWAPKAVATALAAAAASVFVPGAWQLVAAGADARWLPVTAAVLATAAVVTYAAAHRDAAAACFVGLAGWGLADFVVDTFGNAARNERASYAAFGETARREAARRGAALVATGFDKPAPLFDLRLSAPLDRPASLAGVARPVLIVTTTSQRAAVERAVGPCDVVDVRTGTGSARATLLLLAPR